jgi:hypothetical protein
LILFIHFQQQTILKRMNNRLLGTLALLGAPCLLIGSTLENTYPLLAGGWFYGVYGFMHITGWMCSMEVLRRAKATGHSSFGKLILWLILGTLFLANASNVFAIFAPKDRSMLMIVLDSFWPISNLLMFIVGITVIVSKGLSGWQRFIPLVVGLWFPFAMVYRIFLSNLHLPFNVVFTYSTIAWSVLALMAMRNKKANLPQKARTLQWS